MYVINRRLLAGRLVYEDLAPVDQFVFLPVSTMTEVAVAAQCIHARSRSFTFVVSSSFISSLL